MVTPYSNQSWKYEMLCRSSEMRIIYYRILKYVYTAHMYVVYVYIFIVNVWRLFLFFWMKIYKIKTIVDKNINVCSLYIYAFRLLMVYKSRAFFFCLVFFLVLYYYNLVFNVFGLVSSFTRFKYLVRGYIKYILYKRSKKKKTRKKMCCCLLLFQQNTYIHREKHK